MTAIPELIETKPEVVSGPTIKPPMEQSLRLAAFAAVVAIIVMLSNILIGPSIELRAQEDRQIMLAQVLPDELYDNDPTQEQASLSIDGVDISYYRARLNGEISALVMQITTQGYAGPIQLLVAARPDGRLTGVRVLSHNETPGLGDQIEITKSDWIRQFKGLSLNQPAAQRWGVTKDGGEFDAFTGATITPRAVVAGIKQTLELMQSYQSTLLDQAEVQTEDPRHD